MAIVRWKTDTSFWDTPIYCTTSCISHPCGKLAQWHRICWLLSCCGQETSNASASSATEGAANLADGGVDLGALDDGLTKLEEGLPDTDPEELDIFKRSISSRARSSFAWRFCWAGSQASWCSVCRRKREGVHKMGMYNQDLRLIACSQTQPWWNISQVIFVEGMINFLTDRVFKNLSSQSKVQPV